MRPRHCGEVCSADVLKKLRPPNPDVMMAETARRAVRGASGPPWLAGLSESVARMLLEQKKAMDFTVDWHLRRFVAQNNAAIRNILKAGTAFGPIVIPPDDGRDASDYHPDLRDIVPETAVEAEEGFDIEEWWAEVVAFAQGVAQHHRAVVVVSVLRNGGQVVFRVVNHKVSRQIAGGAAGGLAGHYVGGAEGVLLTATLTPILIYLLTRNQE